MGKQLADIALDLKNSDKNVLLIYAFNGVGKTRLSGEFKSLFRQGTSSIEKEIEHKEFLYFNAFTEDLFYWDNDLENDLEMKMKIQSNAFTDWIYREEGKEKEIQDFFTHYTNSKAEANYDPDFTEVSFLIPGTEEKIKISKSEESCFIWSVFFSFLTAIVNDINEAKKEKTESKFKNLKYVFIDDPVTSLDENHLIEQAVDLSNLIKEGHTSLKFIITTHNPLFFNVLSNELDIKVVDMDYRPKKTKRYLLGKTDDGLYQLVIIDDNVPFSYHIYMLKELDNAIKSNAVKKYHFNLLRNILEKTASFLGYSQWGDLLPPDSSYQARLINASSHSRISTTEVPMITSEDITMMKTIVDYITQRYHFRVSRSSETTRSI